MSRTFRKRDVKWINDELILIKKAISEIEVEQDADWILKDDYFNSGSLNQEFFFLIPFKTRKKIKQLSDHTQRMKLTLEFLNEELKKNLAYSAVLCGDRRNWRGSAWKMTKEYSNMKSRSGKRKVINSVLKNTDLNNLENLEDEIIIFSEPNLSDIRGAIWKFD